MVPSVTAAAIFCGLALARLPRRWQLPAAAMLVVGVLVQARPFDPSAAMVLEAQWDRPRMFARREVTRCLPPAGHGDVIMASMGSLAHYMQELSSVGFLDSRLPARGQRRPVGRRTERAAPLRPLHPD